MLRSILSAALFYILISLLVPLPAFGDDPLKTLMLEEHFGVSHPDQIVDFDLDIDVNPENNYLVGPDGEEAPYQILEDGKKLALRTSLPAYTKLIWKLMSGKAPEPYKYPVTVSKKDGYYEISNLIVGIRIPVPSKNLDYAPAPVRAIRYSDGTWTEEAENYISVWADETKEMTVDFIERGPLKVVVQVGYKFRRPEYKYGDKVYKEAGEGYYRSTIEIQAGQPSILFEEDTDMEISYSLNVYRGLYPDQARYRGHHSTAKEYGYEYDGRQYRQWHERHNMDAFVDLAYDEPVTSSYQSSPDAWRRMAIWDPWVYNSGWYWQMYNSGSGREDNLFGIFAGKPSRAIGAADSGVGIYTKPLDDGAKGAGITISANLRCPDGRVFSRVRFCWGMFMGAMAEDLKAPEEVQTIAQQMNLHSGFSLSKIHRYKLDYPDPPKGYGALYMENEILQHPPFHFESGPTSRDWQRWGEKRQNSEEAIEKALKSGTPIADPPQIHPERSLLRYPGTGKAIGRMIRAIATGQPEIIPLQTLNNGAISNFPDDICVEVPVSVAGSQITPQKVGELPEWLGGLTRLFAIQRRMIVDYLLDPSLVSLKQTMSVVPVLGSTEKHVRFAKTLHDLYMRICES